MKKIVTMALAAAAFMSLAVFWPKGQVASAAAAVTEEDPYGILAELPQTREAPAGAYLLEQVLPVAYGKVYRFARMENGAKVFGGQVAVSVGKDGNVLSVNGRYTPLEVAPASLTSEQAAAGYSALSVLPAVYENEAAYDLAVQGRRIMVSARDGRELLNVPSAAGVFSTQKDYYGNDVTLDILEEDGEYILADDLRNIYAYDAAHGYYPERRSEIYTSEDKVFGDGVAVSTFANIVKAYDFYTHAENIGAERYGINGENDLVAGNCGEENGEIPIEIYVHYGQLFENAAFGYDPRYDAGIMYVGDGDENGILCDPGRALDIVAHEYQHGVTHFAAGFVYLNESGALDEAFSDIFGALVEGYDPADARFWSIGEDAVTAGYEDVRSIAGGTEGQSYSVGTMSALCRRGGDHEYHNCDYGSTHANATVVSHVQYEAYRRMPAYFTRERIGKLWYATLCTLTENATFHDFARQLVQAALDLGYSDEAVEALRGSLTESGFLQAGTQNDLHIVTFANYDGTPAARKAFWEGETIIPPAVIPVRADDEQYTYTFRNWDLSAPVAESDCTVQARYTGSLRTFTVRFVDAEGNLLSEECVPYGGTATAPAAPQKAETAQYIYRFTGWNGDPSRVTADTTFSPEYAEEKKSYEVVYYSRGSAYRRVRVAYGETPAGAAPYSPPFSFEKFTGWYADEAYTMSASEVTVTGETALYARWEFDPLPIVWIACGCAAAAAAVITAVVLVKRKRR